MGLAAFSTVSGYVLATPLPPWLTGPLGTFVAVPNLKAVPAPEAPLSPSGLDHFDGLLDNGPQVRSLRCVRNAFSALARVPISQKAATRSSFWRHRRCRGFLVARSGRRIRLHLEASRRSCCSSTVGRRASDTTGRDAFFCCAQSRCATDGLPASSVGFGSSFRVVVLLGFRVVGGKGVCV